MVQEKKAFVRARVQEKKIHISPQSQDSFKENFPEDSGGRDHEKLLYILWEIKSNIVFNCDGAIGSEAKVRYFIIPSINWVFTLNFSR